jgi:DNA-binding transcriptional LysR family regulator
MIAGQEDAVVRPWKPFLMHTHEQLAALRAGAIDIAVCWQPDANESLERNVLARCPFVAVMRLDDPLARLHRVRVCDLQGRQLVISPRADNRFIDSRVEKALADAGISTGSLSEVSRYDELGVHVAARSVVALHPASIVVLNRVPGLTFAEIVDDGMYLDISAVTRRDSRDTDDLVELLRGVALSALDEVLEALHRDVTTVDG